VHYTADEEEGAALVPASSPSADLTRLPVLVVEDQAELQLFYSKILRNTAFQTVPARTLREAREQLRQNPPVAIVLDIMLKGEDTWRWLGELKSDPVTAELPVVIVSEAPDSQKGMALGAAAYLNKPIDRARLIAELNRALGTRILVIDDDAATRYGVRRLLANAGYFVHEAIDGESGIITARATRPQLIVLDLGLPDVEGSEILARLKSDDETRDIPVVVATARDLTPADHQVLDVQARAVLTKRELLDRVVTTVATSLKAA
jgi:CheY-like chemotaxis protein